MLTLQGLNGLAAARSRTTELMLFSTKVSKGASDIRQTRPCLSCTFSSQPEHQGPKQLCCKERLTKIWVLQVTYFDSNANGLQETLACLSGAKVSLPAVAISSAHLTGYNAGCKQCILLVGTGNGIGATPVSTTPSKYVLLAFHLTSIALQLC